MCLLVYSVIRGYRVERERERPCTSRILFCSFHPLSIFLAFWLGKPPFLPFYLWILDQTVPNTRSVPPHINGPTYGMWIARKTRALRWSSKHREFSFPPRPRSSRRRRSRITESGRKLNGNAYIPWRWCLRSPRKISNRFFKHSTTSGVHVSRVSLHAGFLLFSFLFFQQDWHFFFFEKALEGSSGNSRTKK